MSAGCPASWLCWHWHVRCLGDNAISLSASGIACSLWAVAALCCLGGNVPSGPAFQMSSLLLSPFRCAVPSGPDP